MMKEWLGKNLLFTELLYKATRDGFDAPKFHSLIDKKGAVIVLIKSKIN